MLVALFIGSNFGHFLVPWYLWLYALLLDLAVCNKKGTVLKVYNIRGDANVTSK